MGEKRGVCRVLMGNLRERDHLGDTGLDGRIILRWIFRKWDVVYELDLAQDRDRWQAVVNAVMNCHLMLTETCSRVSSIQSLDAD
jgi:hypothetical protein